MNDVPSARYNRYTRYTETVTRFTASGRRVEVTYRPAKMSSYSLGRALSSKADIERPDIYRSILLNRFSKDLWKAFLDKKKRGGKANYSTFKRVFENNLEGILHDVFFPEDRNKKERQEVRGDLYARNWSKRSRELLREITEGREQTSELSEWLEFSEEGRKSVLIDGKVTKKIPPRYTYYHFVDRKIDPEEMRATNRALFNQAMQRTIWSLAHHEGVLEICNDYDKAQAAKEDKKVFGEVVNDCRYEISGFKRKRPLREWLPEDMEQEALEVIWKCAEKYEGRNFARFRTFVKKALKNRLSDLYDYRDADLRIVNDIARPYGSVEGDTQFARQLERKVARAWMHEQEYKGDFLERMAEIIDVSGIKGMAQVDREGMINRFVGLYPSEPQRAYDLLKAVEWFVNEGIPGRSSLPIFAQPSIADFLDEVPRRDKSRNEEYDWHEPDPYNPVPF
ncbi:MAG: hypothetical protein WC595_05525 [Candidatus Nanoarchaeia archaeon]